MQRHATGSDLMNIHIRSLEIAFGDNTIQLFNDLDDKTLYTIITDCMITRNTLNVLEKSLKFKIVGIKSINDCIELLVETKQSLRS